jgi:3-oxoacyl-[acyl-carrier-protein] synthase III
MATDMLACRTVLELSETNQNNVSSGRTSRPQKSMKRCLPVRVAGLGTYLPRDAVSSTDLEKELGVSEGWIERVTGVTERRRARGETTAAMAAAAVREALKDAGTELDEVDLFIGASTGRQQSIPCNAVFIQKELMATEGRSACFDVDATCLSFLFALRVASLYLHTGQCRCVAIASSEVTSLSLNPLQPESAALFGDAAVAAIVKVSGSGESSAIGHSAFSTFSSGAHLTELRGGGTFRHPNDPVTAPEDNMFSMDGPAVLKMALETMPGFFEAFLDQAGAVREDYDLIIPHQASRRGLDFMRRALRLERGRIFSNLAHRGNCVAASIPLALAESRSAGVLQRGRRVLLMGTGAGLTLGAIELIF